MNIGDAFLAGAPGETLHLWIAVAESGEGSLICFNVTTYRPERDTSCVVDSDDHPWVKHKSMINYAQGIEIPKDHADLEAHFQFKECASGALVRKIRLGAVRSNQTKTRFKVEVRRALDGQ